MCCCETNTYWMGLVTTLKALQRAVGYLLIRTGTDTVCDLCIITILVTVCIRGTTNNRIALKRLLMIPHSHSWDCVKFDGIKQESIS